MILFSWPTQNDLGSTLTQSMLIKHGTWDIHAFPDGENKLTIYTDVRDEDVWILASLDHPNEKSLILMMFAQTARAMGARSVKLAAPYLAYMRQDAAFNPGEAVSAVIYAQFISRYFDAMVTVDPHCHRIPRLSDIYAIPVYTLHAQALFKQYIETHVTRPLIIGPDAESAQWMAALAKSLNAPYVVLEKTRLSDDCIHSELPLLNHDQTFTPILIDDIISTGKTLIVPLDQLRAQGFQQPVVLAVHGLFAGDAYATLLQRTPCIVTTNSVPHPSNGIDLTSLLVEGMRDAH